MTPLLDVTATDVGATGCILAAAGDLDHDSRSVLADAAADALKRGRTQLVFDLRSVLFCDSGGLSLFVDTHRRTAELGGSLVLEGAQPEVRAVLVATNLDRFLTLRD